MEVFLCRESDPEVEVYISLAQQSGLSPYTRNNQVFVSVLDDGLTYRAPDVEFRNIHSGTYIFREDDKGRKIPVKVS